MGQEPYQLALCIKFPPFELYHSDVEGLVVSEQYLKLPEQKAHCVEMPASQPQYAFLDSTVHIHTLKITP